MAYQRTLEASGRERSVPNPAAMGKPSLTGKVKWFNKDKGYGFIVPDDGSMDVFVHIKAVQRAGLLTLEQGQEVQFEVITRADGRSAADALRQL